MKINNSLLLVASLFLSQISADAIDDAIALFRRQTVSLSTGVSSSSSSISQTTSTSESITTTTETSTRTTPGNTFTTSSTVSISPTSSDETSTVTSTSTRTPTSSRDSSSSSISPTSASSSITSQSSGSRTLITTSATRQIITTFTYVSDGSTSIGTRTTSGLVAVTSSVDPATLANGGDGNGGSSGLSSTAKKTIGGVVGGIGGALLLGGLVYTAWRIWGKKKNLHDDDLYDPNKNDEKLSTSTDHTPFQSTLDQYHQPGPVNTASNF